LRPISVVVLMGLTLVASLLVVPQTVFMVHANPGTGTVCIEDFTSVPVTVAEPCNHVLSGTTPVGPTFDGPFVTPNHQVQIGLYVNGSDSLNGWDITLLADHTKLVPVSVDPSHSLVGPENIPGASLSIVALCFQGLSKVGNCLATDTIDTLHYSVVGGKTTASPSSGLLFTAVYNITGTTPVGGISIGYQVNCMGAQSIPGQCVAILTGTPIPAPETSMTAVFDNSGTPSTGGSGTSGVPFITASSSANSLTLLVGQSGPVTITATAQNGWPGPAACIPPAPGCSADSILFTEAHTPSLSVGLAPGTTCLTSGTSCSTPAINIKAPTTKGNYSVTFFANYVANSFTTGQNNTLDAPVSVFIRVTDFTWTLSTSSVNVVSGAPPTALLTGTVTSINGFAGTVALTYIPVNGLTVSFSPTSVPVMPGGSVTTQISLNTTLLPGSIATVITRATSTGLVGARTAQLKINVVGGTIVSTTTVVTCTPASAIVGTATSCSASVTDTSTSPTNPSGIVTFSNRGAAGSFSPTTCALTNSGTTAATCVASVSYTPSSVGTGTQSITGMYGGDSTHASSTSAQFTITVTKASPVVVTVVKDSANAAVTSVSLGDAVHDTATMTGEFQAGGTVTYTIFSNSACTGIGTTVSSVTVSVGVVPDSLATTPSSSGTYSFNATYSGDSNNNNAASVCEPFTVNPPTPDFTISASPASTTIVPGASGDSAITVTATNGFSGIVSLTSSAPSGLTATLTPNSISGSGTSSLTISVGSSVAPGSYKVNVTGTSGSHVHLVSVQVFVFDFSVITSQTTVSQLDAGTSASVTITVASLGSTSGTVSLTNSADAGLSCSLAPARVTVGPTVSELSTLACSATQWGNYNVTVSGNSTSLTHSTAKILFEVVDFSVTASPLIVSPVNLGTTANSTITITSLNGFAKRVSLSGSSVSELIIIFSPTSVVGADSSKLSVSAYAPANYTVTVNVGEGGLTHSVIVKFSFLGLSLTAAPGSLSVIVGSSDTSRLTVTSLNGFAGHASLAASLAYPGDLSASLSQSGVDLSKGGSIQFVMTVKVAANAFPYDYIFNVTATSGSLVTWALVRVTVPQPDFTITASSTMLQGLEARASTMVTLNVNPLNGFTGDVTLTVLPAAGMTASTSPTVITGGLGASTLSVKALTAGSYSVTVTAASGSLSHTLTITLSAWDFGMILNPAGSITFDPGSSATSTITISPQNGFAGTVSLSYQAPGALSVQLSPSAVNGGSGTSTFKVTGSELGTYNVTISAVSGSLRHAVIVKVTVSQPPSGVFGLNSPEFYGSLSIVIVIALAAALLVFRARARRSK